MTRPVHILRNRDSGPDLERGESEFLTLDERGETVRRFAARAAVAARYARRFRLEPIPPAALLYLWARAEGRAA